MVEKKIKIPIYSLCIMTFPYPFPSSELAFYASGKNCLKCLKFSFVFVVVVKIELTLCWVLRGREAFKCPEREDGGILAGRLLGKLGGLVRDCGSFQGVVLG